MVFDSPNIRVTVEYGTATLWLGFPGEPVNAFDLARLRELDTAIRTVAATPRIRVLLVRSAKPAGFCAGLRPEALASLPHPTQRANFAWYGQQVFDRLAKLDAVTVAMIDGPCLGVGLELALACDHRICVARPTTHLGFPDQLTCFGGSARLRNLIGKRADALIAKGDTRSGREARALGLVDVACCERRAKIELRTFLDRLELKPVKPRVPAELTGLAAERAALANLTPQPPSLRRKGEPELDLVLAPLPLGEGLGRGSTLPLPETIALLGDDPHASRIVADAVLRGGSAIVCGNRAPLFAHLETALRRGFITPLEAEQARLCVRASDSLAGFERAGLVFVAPGQDPFRLASVVRPRTIVCVISQSRTPPAPAPFPHSRRLLRIGFGDKSRVALHPGPSTAAETTETVAAWLRPFGLHAVLLPGAARLLPQAA